MDALGGISLVPQADYFSKGALAAAQVLKGQDASALAAAVERHTIGVAWGKASEDHEGQTILDLLVRLFARLYPRLSFEGPAGSARAVELSILARAINPNIEIIEASPTLRVAIGTDSPSGAAPTLYVGSQGWDALISRRVPQPVGGTSNPFGAGAAACLAASNLFRAVFQVGTPDLDEGARFSTLSRTVRQDPQIVPFEDLVLDSPVVLVGCGGIGNAAAWALRRLSVRGKVHLVDHDAFDLGNLQRTVMAARADEGSHKAELLAASFDGRLVGVAHVQRFADFVAEHGYGWERVLVAVDSARDRRAIQASLPRWIANAWTQIGDLGLSLHRFDDSEGPCLYCAYIPTAKGKNRDELVAAELGVPERLQEVRELLYRDAPPTPDLLAAISLARSIPPEVLASYALHPLRVLYVEGICGGALVSLAELGDTPQDLHVPLAHQSALAGVLLAAAVVADAAGYAQPTTRETRIDLMHALTPHTMRPVRKSTGNCICKDADYLARYREKWST